MTSTLNSLIFCCLSLILFVTSLLAKEKPFVVGHITCQLGNNMFQVAAASALAWDNGADPLFPDLILPENKNNFKHVLFRCCAKKTPRRIKYYWQLPTYNHFCFTQPPFMPDMQLAGTFQSEKYFAHYREQILQLFAPRQNTLSYIYKKYGHLLLHKTTVAVQIRWFGNLSDEPWWNNLPQYGAEYFQQAMALFPEDTLFLVSSNDYAFARSCVPESDNVIFLEGEPYYIDLFILSLCHHAIISNSTFGWWAAWLNRNPNKKIIAPANWIDPAWHWQTPVVDVYPDDWILLDAPWTKHRWKAVSKGCDTEEDSIKLRLR